MPSFLPHRISPPSKLVVLNQACFDLPTASSEERKWGDDEEVEVADNEDSSRRLDKGKAPMESQNADDMNESTEDSTNTRTPSVTSSARRKWCETDGEEVDEEEAEREQVEEDTEEWLHKQRASLQDIVLTKPVPKKKTPKQGSTPAAQKKDKAPRRKYPTWTPALERALEAGYNPYAGENEEEWRR
ncbi:hypothetical protein K7X08_028585 [Anisodus acutangulus]|uniref:Uncharacterized protein n=1 Tax=Anisodus acutangulus TaxID=402998 RepID=A0A9Q1RDX7_9SOLA|nr:hypothetical protein K7X08_028585 [Anisodus acutangulus]